MIKTAVFSTSEKGNDLAKIIQEELLYTDTFSVKEHKDFITVASFTEFVEWSFADYDQIILIGDLADNITNLYPFLPEVNEELLILNIDVNGDFIQILHVGLEGTANQEAQRIAGITGGVPIISTQAKASKEWDLESLVKRFDWDIDLNGDWESVHALFRTRSKVALILEVRDQGSAYLERTAPSFVEVFYNIDELQEDLFDLLIVISPLLHSFSTTAVYFRPKVLTLGLGCHKNFPQGVLTTDIQSKIAQHGISWKSIKTLATAEIKAKEPALLEVCEGLGMEFQSFHADLLNRIAIPNPSEVIMKHTGLRGLAESAALAVSKTNSLIIEKQNDKPECNQYYTWALAIDQLNLRKGQLEVVGAGPGDPDLITVHGLFLLQKADLIIFSSRLIRDDLLQFVKTGAKIRSTESLKAEGELQDLVYSYYRKGLMTVWLHAGDSALFSGVRNELNAFSERGMDFNITPGVCAFQTLEAQLKARFSVAGEEDHLFLLRMTSDNILSQKAILMNKAQEGMELCIYADRGVLPELHQLFLMIYGEAKPMALSTLKSNRADQIYVCETKDMIGVCNNNMLDDVLMLRIGFEISPKE